ncbi:GDSL esterase/lipase ACHE isoform X2 [Triticum aestivum]|uniref:GDSL esterase/lipase ACHE isoform X2 n=1 Tax=Triticum aestivum TaxID=4565 RepID=UPI001ABCAE61|nr:GDSL esterase/lipase ACHE-like isoform X2 [Triticum aestivum]
MGGIYHETLPKSEYFFKALYTLHFTQNDLSVGYFTNKTTKQIEAYDPDPKERFTVAMQKLRGKLLQIGVVLVCSFCSLCSVMVNDTTR